MKGHGGDSNSDTEPATWTVCTCNTCSGHLEFEASNAGTTVQCPHCGMDTVLFVPAVPGNHEAEEEAPPPRPTGSVTPRPASVRLPGLPPGIPAPPAQPIRLTIGDIGITSDLVVTPNRSGPMSGSQWICMDMSRTESKIPAYAIVLAIIFALLCLIGLLFLLIKDTVTSGYVEVSVQAGKIYHKTQIPISNPQQVAHIRKLVSIAQEMAAQVRQ
jgi:hypothetical protein